MNKALGPIPRSSPAHAPVLALLSGIESVGVAPAAPVEEHFALPLSSTEEVLEIGEGKGLLGATAPT